MSDENLNNNANNTNSKSFSVKSEEFFYNPSRKISNLSSSSSSLPNNTKSNISQVLIRDVWEYNFEEELQIIADLTEKYNVIAMDTEFPGINYPPPRVGEDKDFEYQLIRENVKNSKLIQLGISIADEEGNVPKGTSTWQFNFKFDEDNDVICSESQTLLKNAGIDFQKLKVQGIDQAKFAEYITCTDIVLNEDVKWVAFHGGFDFVYILQMLYGQATPESPDNFTQLMKIFFPVVFDLKYIIRDFPHLRDTGLNKLASEIKVDRIGPQHQAGSDSLLTLAVYFKLRDGLIKEQNLHLDKSTNVIYGIGKGYQSSNNKGYLWNYKMMYWGNDYDPGMAQYYYPNFMTNYDNSPEISYQQPQVYQQPTMNNYSFYPNTMNYYYPTHLEEANLHNGQVQPTKENAYRKK